MTVPLWLIVVWACGAGAGIGILMWTVLSDGSVSGRPEEKFALTCIFIGAAAGWPFGLFGFAVMKAVEWARMRRRASQQLARDVLES